MEFELYQMEAEEKNEKAISQYQLNISKISAGRANPQVLDSIKIDYFETLTPINQLASISVPEPRQLLITPFDKSINKDIVSIINSSSIGLSAVDEGDKTRITIPELTKERRNELVKSLTNYTEQAKISIRSARQEANKKIKADEELSEDQVRAYQDEIQKITDAAVAQVDDITKIKEKDLMTI